MTWDPTQYLKFGNQRLRPALDLLARVPLGQPLEVVDLGCGAGNVTQALRARWPGAATRITGVDSSPEMLAQARIAEPSADWVEADIAGWHPPQPVDLIFSNAALHWLEGHAALMPRLASFLVPGGVLAVQMPRQFGAPSHRFLRDIAVALFPDRFAAMSEPPVQTAAAYWEMLSGLGQVQAWETDYVQVLEPTDGMHPVRGFTEATAMRPFVEKLTGNEVEVFASAYDKALASAYPVLADGSALMAFRRIFFVLKV